MQGVVIELGANVAAYVKHLACRAPRNRPRPDCGVVHGECPVPSPVPRYLGR